MFPFLGRSLAPDRTYDLPKTRPGGGSNEPWVADDRGQRMAAGEPRPAADRRRVVAGFPSRCELRGRQDKGFADVWAESTLTPA